MSEKSRNMIKSANGFFVVGMILVFNLPVMLTAMVLWLAALAYTVSDKGAPAFSRVFSLALMGCVTAFYVWILIRKFGL